MTQDKPLWISLHHPDRVGPGQPESLVGDPWTTEVVPHLPATLAAQARALTAFQRVRGVATPTDLLRAVLIGLAAIAETAWRQRLRASNAWLLWLLGALLAAPGPPPEPAAPGSRRVRLVEATRSRHPGGTGDAWRVHVAYDGTAGRLDEVGVTDQPSAERLAHCT